MPQTRFQRQVIGAASNLVRWAANPWRRLSLLTIVLLASFSIGGALGSITGALAKLDPLSAGFSVVLMELAIRARGPLQSQPGDRLGLQLLDMARIGLLYGLLIDGFKLV